MHEPHGTDRERWNLRGPVRACTLHRTWSACGADRQCGTHTRSDTASVEFRPDGALTQHRHENPDGSAWESIREYDESGRLRAARNGSSGGPADTSIYEYDAEGRLQRIIRRLADGRERIAETYEYSETSSTMFGGLGEDRQTRDYNERGDQAQEILESNHRSGSIEEDGQFVDDPGSPKSHRSEARFVYDYDRHGNCVRKVVEGRSDPNADFSVSTIETREIEYFATS